MDGNTSLDGTAKKIALEELSKEELVKKCRTLLALAQKAKHVKDVLTDENTKLREQMKSSVSEEVIENLTQQKLGLVTALEELKGQRKALERELATSRDQLKSSEIKLGELDTENQSFKRQVFRLTEENEQLINHLDGLEKQIEELKRIGLEQQQQLLVLEKNNGGLEVDGGKVEDGGAMVELQKMLAVSLEEVQKLKTENCNLNSKITTCISELSEKSDELEKLRNEIETFKTQPLTSLEKDNELLKSTLNESAESIQLYQQEIEDKNKEIEKHTSTADDLNTEVHKNRALIQKLKQDIASMSHRLNDNQIVSSGLTTDLQNTNEKMKDKLKFYHSKIVKFAGDVKRLKEDKQFILENFKTYNDQVQVWREQLVLATQRLVEESNAGVAEKKLLVDEIQSGKEQIIGLNEKIVALSDEIENFKKTEVGEDERKKLLEEISDQKEQIVCLIREKETENDYLTERWLIETIKVQDLKKELDGLKVGDDISNKPLKDDEVAIEQKKANNEELLEEIQSQKEQILTLIQEKETMNDELTERILILSNEIQDLKKATGGEISNELPGEITVQKENIGLLQENETIAVLSNASEDLKKKAELGEDERKMLLEEISDQKAQIVYLINEKVSENDELTEKWLIESIKVDELRKELDSLKLSYADALKLTNDEVNGVLVKKNEELLEEIKSQKEQIVTLIQEKASSNDELTAKIVVLSNEIQDLKKVGVETSIDERNKLIEEVASHKEETGLVQENKTANETLVVLNNESEELKKAELGEDERKMLLEEISDQKAQIVYLINEKVSENDELTEKWLIESIKVDELRKELDSVKLSYADALKLTNDEVNGVLVKKNEELLEEIQSQKEQIVTLIQEKVSSNDELAERIVVLSNEIQDLKKVGVEGLDRNQASIDERNKLIEEIASLKDQIGMLIGEKESTNDELTERIVVLSNEIQDLKKEMASTKLSQLDDINLIKRSSNDEKNLLGEEIALQKEQIVGLIREKESCNEKLVVLSSKIQDLEKQLSEACLIKDANEKELAVQKNNSEKLCLELGDKETLYVEEIKSLKHQLNEAIKLHESLQQENKALNIQVEQLKGISVETVTKLDDAQIISAENVELKSKLSAKVDELKNVITENESFRNQLVTTKSTVDDNNRLIQELRKAIEHLENEFEISKSNEIKLVEKYGQEESKLTRENQSLQDKNEELLNKLATLEEKLENLQRTTDIEAIRRENTELLAEMNEMNQALKERGETINRQQIYCDEVLMKMSQFEAQITQHEDTIQQNNNLIKSLQEENLSNSTELTQLREETSQLKDKLDSSTENCYADSETLSTSTISRCDEANRLKDLEGSWEERYGKLRTLALKLKSKIRELTLELNKEQVEKADAQQKLASSTKTVQTIQTQCDKLQDELERCKVDNKNILKQLDNLKSDVAKDKKQITFNEDSITKLKSEIDGLNKEKNNVENWKKQVGVKVQSLKKELEANTVLRKDFESRIQKLTADLDLKEKSLKEEKEKHAHTKTSLLESNNECKKQSVLNLEMQDYERSIKDLSLKLEKKNELVTKLKNQVDSQKSTVNALKEQNRLLDERTNSFESEISAYRIEVNTFKKNVSDLEVVVNDKDLEIQENLKVLENTRSENEDLSTQLSKVIAEHQKTNSLLRGEKDHLRGENLGLEQRLLEVEDRLKMREQELEGVQNEYKGYKVRAQSVLRQNQSRDVGLEEKLMEEAASLRAKVEVLNGEIGEMKMAIEKLSAVNGSLQLEKSEVERAKLELVNEIDECKEEYKKLQVKHQQATAEHAESMRGLKVHADTLAQCYRQQISEQEVRHNREIIELQSKLEKGSTTTDIPPLTIPTMPREEGEGSESVDSTNGNIHPLEKLLGTDQDHEISIIKKQLTDNESKVMHLTALLADTEQDLAKHVQMNKVLKEEIRRQQRSVEREKHAENLEYMKNVVFKFITLSSGDERQRMVPVLNTILKLSPEETQKLNLVAKGDKSWSAYLPTWSSPGKPQ